MAYGSLMYLRLKNYKNILPPHPQLSRSSPSLPCQPLNDLGNRLKPALGI